MSQPIPDRQALDSLLAHFATSADEQNPQTPESNGERHELNGGAHPEDLNGRLSELETLEINGHLERQLPIAPLESQNGRHDPSTPEPINATPSQVHRGNGSGYVNGSAPIEASLKGAMTEILATTAVEPDAIPPVETNGAAAVEIGEPPLLPTGDIDEAPAADNKVVRDEVQEPQAGTDYRPTFLSEHPAAGSLFTPYLVTEIRELRNRCRRRSWWRRLFG
jgi:hypothetical protein